jgi:DNA-binding response OmpR family regulator
MTKQKILFVDDEPHLLTTVGDFLRSKAYDVTCVSSGEKALDEVRRQAFDLIILDIGMPGIGGLGFLKRMDPAGGKERIPVLVLTARANMEDFFKDMEIDGFLSKSCSREELLDAIASILARSRRRSRSANANGRPRVTVVDDSEAAAEAIKKAMVVSGMLVEVLYSDRPVVEHVLQSPPDALVLKEDMAIMSGSMIAQMVSKLPGVSSVPIVLHDTSLASGSAGEIARRRAPAGVTEWVSSSQPEFLVRVVKRVLGAPQ